MESRSHVPHQGLSFFGSRHYIIGGDFSPGRNESVFTLGAHRTDLAPKFIVRAIWLLVLVPGLFVLKWKALRACRWVCNIKRNSGFWKSWKIQTLKDSTWLYKSMGLDFCLIDKSGRRKEGAFDPSIDWYRGGAVDGRFIERIVLTLIASSLSSTNLTRFSIRLKCRFRANFRFISILLAEMKTL